MYERFRIVRIGVEVFESEVAIVTGFLECLDHSGPVGGTVEKGTKRLQRVVGAFLGEFLEVDVLDAFAELGYPVFGKLEQHNVAGIEMNVHVLTAERIYEIVHFLGRQQETVEEFNNQVQEQVSNEDSTYNKLKNEK